MVKDDLVQPVSDKIVSDLIDGSLLFDFDAVVSSERQIKVTKFIAGETK